MRTEISDAVQTSTDVSSKSDLPSSIGIDFHFINSRSAPLVYECNSCKSLAIVGYSAVGIFGNPTVGQVGYSDPELVAVICHNCNTAAPYIDLIASPKVMHHQD